MDIEYRLPLIECRCCDRFIMRVKRQTYLYPTGTRVVTKVYCKHQEKCIKQHEKQKGMEKKNHENG